MKTLQDPRPSPIAGQWYPADADRLLKQVQGYIENANIPNLSGEVVAIMAPHAGHRYSGPVAGHAFKVLSGLTPEIVAVISPMHHPYEAPLFATLHSSYMTPLGSIPVDEDALAALENKLKDKIGIGITYLENDLEHSLEIELPFLQVILEKPYNLLPVMVREQNEHVARALGEALADVLMDRDAIMVASTDLSHFYPRQTAEILDTRMLEKVEAFDPQGILELEVEGEGFACGRGALAAVLWASNALGADEVQILNYGTSGDITGDYSQVVGYGAAVVTRRIES